MSKPIKAAVVTKEQTGADFIVDTKLNTDGYAQIKSEMKVIKRENLIKNVKQIFLNPILIATMVGFIFWVTQLIPGIAIVPDQNDITSGQYFSPLRLDNTFPPLFKVTKTLEALCTPLAWLAIGITLAKGNFKDAAQDKKSMIWNGNENYFCTIIWISISLCGCGNWKRNWSMKIRYCWIRHYCNYVSSPPAAVIVAYSIAYKKQPLLKSNLTLIATLFSIISLLFWVIITTAIGATPLFS